MGIAFERIVIVMLENSTRATVLENAYMNQLRRKGVFLSNSYGVTHSSQPNYIAAIGGDTFDIHNDDPSYVKWIYTNPMPNVTSIVDLLEAQNLTWKSYAEDLPPKYTTEAAAGLTSCPVTYPAEPFPFARKHVPFLSFANVVGNPNRLAKIVDGTQFGTDLKNGELPHFSWYTPNLINDGHTLSAKQQKVHSGDNDRQLRVENIAAFLETFLGADPIDKFPPETLIVITFDEAYPYDDPYEIYTLLIGDMLTAGTTCTVPYNHFSLLRSVEVNFGLGSLHRNDAVARPYYFLPQ